MFPKYKDLYVGMLIVMIGLICVSCSGAENPTTTEVSTQEELSTELITEKLAAIKDIEEEVVESLGAVEESTVSEEGVHEKQATFVEAQLAKMSIEEKVGQLFFLDLQSYETLAIPAGGIIFFRHDLSTWEGTIEMIQRYQNEAKIPLFIGIDEEGGIVTRITGDGSIGGTVVASSWHLAHSDDVNAVYGGSNTIASELERLGFNMNFAPVADINSNPDNPIIGKRAFSDDPIETATNVVEALSAYEAYEVIPVVKHFPGHGNTQGDSHDDLVYIEGDREQLLANECQPFIAAIERGVEVIMMGHIILADVPTEGEQVASMNKDIIQGLLIEELGYTGLVISDSLLMGSITNYMTIEEVVDQGLYAGLDMFLMPETPQVAYDYLLEQAKASEEITLRVEMSVRKILALKEELQ